MDSFVTIGYKGGYIHMHFSGGKEVIRARFGDKTQEGFKSLLSAKAWIRKQSKGV